MAIPGLAITQDNNEYVCRILDTIRIAIRKNKIFQRIILCIENDVLYEVYLQNMPGVFPKAAKLLEETIEDESDDEMFHECQEAEQVNVDEEMVDSEDDESDDADGSTDESINDEEEDEEGGARPRRQCKRVTHYGNNIYDT